MYQVCLAISQTYEWVADILVVQVPRAIAYNNVSRASTPSPTLSIPVSCDSEKTYNLRSIIFEI